MYFRMTIWILALAFTAFVLTGGKNLASLSTMITTTILGALLGFLFAMMFTLRKHRRESREGR